MVISPYQVNVASWYWVKYSDFVHVTRTVASDPTAKVTLTVRVGPLLSVITAGVPSGTLTAEHDTDDGDTVKKSST